MLSVREYLRVVFILVKSLLVPPTPCPLLPPPPPDILLARFLWTSNATRSFPFSSVAPAPLNERQRQLKKLEYSQQPVMGTIETIVCSQHCGAKSRFVAQCVLGIPLHQYNRPSLMPSYSPHLRCHRQRHTVVQQAIIIRFSPRLRSPPFARDHKAPAAILNRC